MTNKKYKTYCLSSESLKIIDRLSEDFYRHLGAEISQSKILDSMILYCRDISFQAIIDKNKV